MRTRDVYFHSVEIHPGIGMLGGPSESLQEITFPDRKTEWETCVCVFVYMYVHVYNCVCVCIIVCVCVHNCVCVCVCA